MLLSVRGMERQAIQNLTQVAYQVPERALASLVAQPERAIRRTKGQETSDFPVPGEAPAMLREYGPHSLARAFAEATRYVGGRPSAAAAHGAHIKQLQREHPTPGATGVHPPGSEPDERAKEGVTDALYRGFGFFDTVAKQLAYNAEQAAQRERGAPGGGRAGRPGGPTEAQAQERAEEASQYRTVSQPMGARPEEASFFRGIEWAMRQWNKFGQSTVGQHVIPFMRIIWNATKYNYERSPVGGVKAAIDVARYATARARGKPTFPATELYERIARPLYGTLAGLALIAAAGEDNLTGPLPEDDEEKKAWRREGKTPFSVRVAGHWVPTALAPGLNATLVQVMTIRDFQRRAALKGEPMDAEHYARLVGRLVSTIATNMAFQPFAQNLYEALDKVFNPPEGGYGGLPEAAADITQGRFVPGVAGLRELERAGGEYERAPRDPLEQVMAQVPVLSGLVPVRRTMFGEPVARQGAGEGLKGAAERLFTPETARPGREHYSRYRGVPDAAIDTIVHDAVVKVDNYQKALKDGKLKTLGPEDFPTPEEKAIAKWAHPEVGPAREREDWPKWRAKEKDRLAAERAQGGPLSRAARLVGATR